MTDFHTSKARFDPYHYQSNNGFDGFHNLTFTTTDPVSTHVTFSVSHTQHAKYAYKADVKLKPDNCLDLWINNRHVEEVSGGPVYSSTFLAEEPNNIYYFTSDNAYNDVYKISVYDDYQNFIDGSLLMEVTLFYK